MGPQIAQIYAEWERGRAGLSGLTQRVWVAIAARPGGGEDRVSDSRWFQVGVGG